MHKFHGAGEKLHECCVIVYCFDRAFRRVYRRGRKRPVPFPILAQTSEWIAIDKPPGWSVHPTPLSRAPNCLHALKKKAGTWVTPLHRLDEATSGILLFATSPEAAAKWAPRLASPQFKKGYLAGVRGWTPDQGIISRPLQDVDARVNGARPLQAAESRFLTVARGLVNAPGGRYSQLRISLVQVRILTGRRHQIRRHLAGLSHPIIGDTTYGDGHATRWGRSIGSQGLLLRAVVAEFLGDDQESAWSIRTVDAGPQGGAGALWSPFFQHLGASSCGRNFDL